jgi:hypothetical protein
MVTFLTLLLGLVVGERQIELVADDRIAIIEVWLDRTLVGVVRAPPWRIKCDFGDQLAPHLLEAVGRDDEGRELDRAMQKVNLPREPAEVTLALHGGDEGYREVEIAWRALGGNEPEEIHLSFDGEAMEVTGRRVGLPPHDPRATHVIAAELVFPMQLRANAGLAFGGAFGDEVSSDLTAVPLERTEPGDSRLPSATEVETWLRVRGAAPRVVAVERGLFELIVVRDEASLKPLRVIGEQVRSGTGGGRKDMLRFVGSRPQQVRADDGSWSAVFPVTPNLNTGNRGLPWVLTHGFFGTDQEGEIEELDPAVAMAGLQAAGSNRPRGVLLIRGAGPALRAAPGLDSRAIRGYLAALRVPFFYWRIDGGGDATPDVWGAPTRIRDRRDLGRAASELVSALRPQFLVWLDGSYMPGEVTLTSGAPAPLRLAGGATR